MEGVLEQMQRGLERSQAQREQAMGLHVEKTTRYSDDELYSAALFK